MNELDNICVFAGPVQEKLNAPIEYIKDYIPLYNPSAFILNRTFNSYREYMFAGLRDSVEWEQREAPRKEAFYSTRNEPYTYGSGRGVRTYHPKASNYYVDIIRDELERDLNCKLEACFLNYYLTQKDHLGWHADDSDVLDMTRPIAVVTFGVERYIWFKENGSTEMEKLLLHDGSLLTMKPGMQLTHQHRIPKHDRHCGERISLTYRGLK